MFRRLLPKEVCFFEYFEQHAAITIQACREFSALVKDGADINLRASRIKDIEHNADNITHRCVEELNKTFITPIDRVDIHQLIKTMDDIVDSVDACTSRMALYELTEMRVETQQMADILLQASLEIEAAVKELRNLRDVKDLETRLVSIHHLENEGDQILRAALTRLFKEEEDQPIKVIKWKEVFERLEKATDRCEEVANIIEKIVIEAS